MHKKKVFISTVLAATLLLGAKGAPRAMQFPFSLFRKLATSKIPPEEPAAGNLIFSPYSVSRAFLLASLGARGVTRTRIERIADVRADVAPPSDGENAPTLEVANRIWIAKEIHVNPDYIDAVKKEAGATPGIVDFAANPGEATHTINSWVATQTHDKIENLIPPGALNARTRLILANAIYFKGAWQTPFKKPMTQDADFSLLNGQTVKVPMMREHDRFNFTQDSTAQVIELPYLGRDFAMIIALPKKGGSILRLQSALSPQRLDHWESAMRFVDVELSMPKFKFSSDFVLNSALKSMGLGIAFEPGHADFSGIDGARDLYVSNVFHKAFISVDEAGTEAAAATAIELRMKAILRGSKPVVMNIDHPFVFLIQDLRSKAVLFMGRVADPKE